MKAIALVSGGIDSPVSAYLASARGVDVIPVFFNNRPFSGMNTLNRAIESASRLRELCPSMEGLAIFEHGASLAEFAAKCERRYGCVLCKRMMFRAASAYGESVGASALITGDSLAQVASQTLQNLYVTEQASSLPIIRPLVGMDKLEIEAVAKKIGTFEISIQQAECCSAVPPKPSTAAQLSAILEEESKVDIGALLTATLESATRA